MGKKVEPSFGALLELCHRGSLNRGKSYASARVGEEAESTLETRIGEPRAQGKLFPPPLDCTTTPVHDSHEPVKKRSDAIDRKDVSA